MDHMSGVVWQGAHTSIIKKKITKKKLQKKNYKKNYQYPKKNIT